MSGVTTIVDELKSGKTVTYFTVGESMRPLLCERKTHVTVVPLDFARRGDIVLYVRKNGVLVLHRLMKIDGEAYYMRGDNTCGLERIDKSQAIGKVTHIYRKARQFSVEKSASYKVYVTLWRVIYPCRWLLQKAAAVLRRLK